VYALPTGGDALLQSRSKSAPSAKLEKVALRRRQLEALLTHQPAHLNLEGGGSPDDPPPAGVFSD